MYLFEIEIIYNIICLYGQFYQFNAYSTVLNKENI